MYIKLILLTFCATQIFANNLTDSEYYYPLEDNGELMFKNIFTKLNTIIVENQEISKKLVEINKRLDTEASLLALKSCNQIQNSEWTVIQRRQDGSVNFNRNWNEYKQGFGNPNGEFFIGLEKLHALTSSGARKELWIVLRDFDNELRYAIYDYFVLGNEAEKYSLKELGEFRGNAGDYLSYHKGLKFTTEDTGYCAKSFQGAWWYKGNTLEGCYWSNLNGPYLKGINPTGGVAWGGFHAWNYSLKFVEMLIRPAA